MFDKPSLDSLLHYGIQRKSGRYPWGSGEDPYQKGGFYSTYQMLKAEGKTEKEIADSMGMNTTQLRTNITWAKKERKEFINNEIGRMKEEGLSNSEIGRRLDVSEATVRNYISPVQKNSNQQLDNINNAIAKGVDNSGYLDVGVGVERQLGISRTKFNAVVNKMVQEDGYHLHEVYVKRLSDAGSASGKAKYTTVKVLTKEADPEIVNQNKANVRNLESWSDDAGMTIQAMRPPLHIGLDRIHVRYAEDGGAQKDGLIELRPGAKDLDLGKSRYAQVRIAAGDDLYLKGMAAYGIDKFPEGKDIIFNTNKTKDVPVEKVLKKMDMDNPDNPFGANIKPGGQKGALNIVNEQGDWDTWSKTMSSQFLSKQPLPLIKDRLDDTYDNLRREFDEINAMTNPVVKKHLMDKYIEGMDAKAKHLKAKGLAGTKSHVLLPFPDMKPNEIYAPNYDNGERVVLVRHPHGGTFEIPELVVNNKQSSARKMLGNVPDAVGIHPSVAEKLSGADFDGDTALVIPNNRGMVKTTRTLKELKNFGDEMHTLYKRDYETISPRNKQIEMGKVSNLITDMTIKGASPSELARAVRHSMVVIDSEKHKLDYKQSARDNGIKALTKKYQSHINPETGKASTGASTLISRSKRKIDLSQHETAKELARDKVDRDGKVLKKGMTTQEIATKLAVSEDTVKGYLNGKQFDVDKYSSNTAVEDLYVNYVKGIQATKNEAMKISSSIPRPDYSKEAARLYEPEVKSLNAKLNDALMNAPRERQAQILTEHLYYQNLKPNMEKDDKKKLKARSLAKARDTVGAKKSQIKITDKEWEAIQARAVSTTKLEAILNNADIDVVRKLASPRVQQLSTSKAGRARELLSKGYTYSEVAQVMGVTTTVLREELS